MKLSLRLPIFLVAILVSGFSCAARANGTPIPQAPSPGATPGAAVGAANSAGEITLPGPLRSFLRMAGISQKVAPDEVMPFLARQIVVQGYHDARKKDATPNEFLVLLKRYIAQARAVQRMAGASGMIRISSCAEATPLLRVLGFHLREGCGADVAIETQDSQQGFLAADSGFPLAQLEDAVRGNKPFEFQYTSVPVPLLFSASDWIETDKNSKDAPDVLDSLINDGTLARLYWAMSRLDGETRESLRKSPGLHALQPLAPLLDFYGSQITIRSGLGARLFPRSAS